MISCSFAGGGQLGGLSRAKERRIIGTVVGDVNLDDIGAGRDRAPFRVVDSAVNRSVSADAEKAGS